MVHCGQVQTMDVLQCCSRAGSALQTIFGFMLNPGMIRALIAQRSCEV